VSPTEGVYVAFHFAAVIAEMVASITTRILHQVTPDHKADLHGFDLRRAEISFLAVKWKPEGKCFQRRHSRVDVRRLSQLAAIFSILLKFPQD
jgi:hypothetical protein